MPEEPGREGQRGHLRPPEPVVVVVPGLGVGVPDEPDRPGGLAWGRACGVAAGCGAGAPRRRVATAEEWVGGRAVDW